MAYFAREVNQQNRRIILYTKINLNFLNKEASETEIN